MPTIRDRIVEYLSQHPEGADDDELTQALGLRRRQQANSRCRTRAAEGFVARRSGGGKLRNFLISVPVVETVRLDQSPVTDRPWFWEGRVQAAVVVYLETHGYTLLRQANTATHETGKDIEAKNADQLVWVTVKGWPTGTPLTRPSTQAAHWFKQALFDIVVWRGEDRNAILWLALPDYPRYRKLAQKVAWLQSVARFEYAWVCADNTVIVEPSI